MSGQAEQCPAALKHADASLPRNAVAPRAAEPVETTTAATATAETAPVETDPFAQFPRVEPTGRWLPPMVSYAQNFEDVILRRVLQDVERGFYVDVGAWHPVRDSVTCWFYRSGWRGLNIEPEAEMFGFLATERLEDCNVMGVVGARSGMTLFAAHSGRGTSRVLRDPAAEPEDALPHRIVPTPMVTLDELMQACPQRQIDFLKIDAEGSEGDVLAGAMVTLTQRRPRVLLIEATEAGSQIPAHAGWEPALLAQGYLFAYFDGLNRFYLRTEDARLLRRFDCPPCVFDNFLEPTIEARAALRTAP